jgi:hypothetical protein
MEIQITTNFPSVSARLARLQQDVGNRALASAVNKTLALARTQMTREITQEFAVSAGYVRDRLRIRRATARGGRLTIEGSLIGGGVRGRKRSANIIAFVEKSVTLAEARKRAKAGTRRALFVKIKRKGGKKLLEGKYGHGAFIGNKGRTVFEREGDKRLPIRPVQTIDVAQMFNTRRINDAVVRLMRQRFGGIFDNEARVFIARFNQGGRK